MLLLFGIFQYVATDTQFVKRDVLHLFEERCFLRCGPGSSVGITTGYGLDGLGIESRWGRDFLHLSRLALGPNLPPAQGVPGLNRE
jgi:hypothetical protein